MNVDSRRGVLARTKLPAEPGTARPQGVEVHWNKALAWMVPASYTAYCNEADGPLGEMFSYVPDEPVTYKRPLEVGGREAGLGDELLEAGMAVQLVTYRFTVQDYHRMAEAGIFHEDDRLELLQGEIVEMPPIGPGHAGGVKRLMNSFLPLQVEGKAIISVQDPIHLGEHSEPQPDLALLRPRPDFYDREHPGPEDVFLVVEVMDSSASYDREVKVPLYARFSVPETWLLDVEQGLIAVYRAPGPEGYQQIRTLRRGERLSPQAFPELNVMVDVLLG